jgi:predicted transposase/invertase (TIGR01784 family)
MAAKTNDLLNPKNDYVFFRIFSEEPELLIDLINAVRMGEASITEITLLDARLTPERITGKRLVLDLKAVDERGQRFNVEMQMRSVGAWGARGTLYAARMLSEQPDVGTDYRAIKPVIGIHLLNFTLFKQAKYATKAVWNFELRNNDFPEVTLGREMQINVVELPKADKLQQLPEQLSAWIAYFEHWNEDDLMNNLAHPPIQKARAKLRAMSADEEERHWAEAREKALRDEATLIGEAHDQGFEEGDQQARRENALNLLRQTQLDAATIASCTSLSEDEVQQLSVNREQH